jgi:spore maturation protein CgeB
MRILHLIESSVNSLTCRNEEKFLDRIRYLLSHPVQAEGIRRAGRRRALAEHTYHRRYPSLFDAIGLDYSTRTGALGALFAQLEVA